MTLSIKQQTLGEGHSITDIVQLSGNVTRLEPDADNLSQQLTSSIRPGSKLILGLGDVKAIDGYGVREIVRAWGNARDRHTELVLINPGKDVIAQLKTMHLIDQISHYDTLTAAIEALSRNPRALTPPAVEQAAVA